MSKTAFTEATIASMSAISQAQTSAVTSQFAAVADFKSQLCRDAKCYVEKHTVDRKGRQSEKATTQVLLYEVAGVQQLEFLLFILVFKDFAFHYLSARTSSSRNSLLQSIMQHAGIVVRVDGAAATHCHNRYIAKTRIIISWFNCNHVIEG